MSDQVPAEKSDRPTRWRRIVVIGVLLPLAAASVLIWSATGRQDHIDKVPVAIVNNDTIITDPQPMAAGRSLAAALTHPADPSNNLQWVLADQDNASKGLEDGSFYAVLTIPSDFSSAILSSGTDTPVQGKVSLVSNAAASTTVPYLSSVIASAAASALGNQVTVSYLGQVYDGFNSLAQGNQQSASGAAQLATGTQQLASGATQLSQGALQLAAGLDGVSSGSAQLATGAASVHSGAVKLDGGVGELARGTRTLHDGQARLAAGTRTLARESDVLAGRSRELHAGARVVAAGSRIVAGGSRLLSDEVTRLSRECNAAGGSAAFCADLGRAAQHTDTLGKASARLGTAAGRLADGSDRLAGGAGEIARGADRAAASSKALSDASGKLSKGASSLQQGAASLAGGAAKVDRGAAQLAGGTRSTATAGHQLASGSATLASSAGQVDDGAQQLSSGLAKAAAQSPTYSKQLKQALSAVVAEPVALATHVQYTAHGNGWLIAIILGVILWLAALVAALSVDQSAVARNAMAPVGSRMVAITQSLPVLGFAVLNAVAVVVALLLFHPSTAAMVPLALLVLLAAATFSLLALGMRLRWGRVGLTLFVLFLILQVAASGNVVPLETAPTVLRTLNDVLPLTAFVNGASQLVSGGHVASYVAVVAVLLAWSLVSCALLLSSVKRRRLADPVRPQRVALSPG
jgi:putative membrane protein